MPAPQIVNYLQVLATVSPDVAAHPADLARHYSSRFGVSRMTATKLLHRLESDGWISRSGPSTRPIFSLGYKRRVLKSLSLEGLDEEAVWVDDVSPFIAAASNVRNILHHGLTEMVNNAIDHSGGTALTVNYSQNETLAKLSISDDGIGIFERISEALRLPDKRLALYELSKGKLTTDPSRHSGEGIFFTSRMFEYFTIRANDLTFEHSDSDPHDILSEASSELGGTSVFMGVHLDSARNTSEIFNQFMNAPDDFGFNKTIVPMRLAQYGEEQLISRSQAKRLIARFDRFKLVILDFFGVNEIGQAFADELFRVYPSSHPDVELSPVKMTEQVERMYLRAVGHKLPGSAV